MKKASHLDFEEFINFTENFTLKSISADTKKTSEISRAHTQFFALLTAGAELLSNTGSVNKEFFNSYGELGSSYLNEVVSDCSEFLMCILMGLYRASGCTLRSAIESYLKAFSVSEQPLILKRTSVPQVFDDAAGTSFFSSKHGKKVISELKGIYNDLNLYVHTVSEEQMFRVLAVGSFPRWSNKSIELVNIFVRVIRQFLYGVVLARRDLYDKFDYRNRIVINRALTKSQRRIALGVDE